MVNLGRDAPRPVFLPGSGTLANIDSMHKKDAQLYITSCAASTVISLFQRLFLCRATLLCGAEFGAGFDCAGAVDHRTNAGLVY